MRIKTYKHATVEGEMEIHLDAGAQRMMDHLHSSGFSVEILMPADRFIYLKINSTSGELLSRRVVGNADENKIGRELSAMIWSLKGR